MTTQITKVGRKGDNVIIHTVDHKNGDTVTSVLNSESKPVPEFDKSFADLGKYMCGLMGFPDDWTRDHHMTWLSVGQASDENSGKDTINAICSISVKLAKFAAPMNVNTPLLREKVAGIPSGGTFMPPKMLELVKTVIEHADDYLNGTRAQHELLPHAERGSKSAKAGGKKKMTDEEIAKGQAEHFGKTVN